MTLQHIAPWLSSLMELDASIAANPVAKPGPKSSGEAKSNAENQVAYRAKKMKQRKQNIAVLDMETDPFDSATQAKILPFCACLYSNNFEPVIIWEENRNAFVTAVIAAIEALPERYTIYAHNGGRFDFLFLVHKLRGEVKFKGRGIMCASIGEHELRDSFHIIPERLASYHKEAFDYSKMKVDRRNKHRSEIIEYLVSDCRYLLDIVIAFVEQHGFRLSIGQAAMAVLRKHYTVKKLSQGMDQTLRPFYFGGRVECLQGRGHFKGDYKLIDINSQYPDAMAKLDHPIGDFWDYEKRTGAPGDDTVFIDLTCDNNNALIARGENGETTANIKRGRFFTTIWEHDMALKHGLIKNVSYNYILDCALRTNFSDFIVPLYDNRLRTKASLDELKRAGGEGGAAWFDLKKDDIFYKLLLNNSYGKFAQNPERYKEHYITNPGDTPESEWLKSIGELEDAEQIKYLLPLYQSDEYWIYHKPSPSFRYNNVGTAASITGAARAKLMDGIQHCRDVIYCDTDSIICGSFDGLEISKTALGAWDMEDEFSEVIIDGKKLYAVWHKTPRKRSPDQIAEGIDPRYTVKSKGASRLNWNDMLAMLRGDTVVSISRAPTITKFGTQNYMTRNLRATAPILRKAS